jgi:hypothetical protein
MLKTIMQNEQVTTIFYTNYISNSSLGRTRNCRDALPVSKKHDLIPVSGKKKIIRHVPTETQYGKMCGKQ